MKKHLLFLILILTSLFITSSSYAYSVVGNQSCGSIITFDKEGNLYTKTGSIQWVRGYITGRNYEFDRNLVNRVPDPDSLYYAVVKFCKDNPLKGVNDAAIYIYSTLN